MLVRKKMKPPHAVYHTGKTFLTYPASFCGTPDYKLSTLTWDIIQKSKRSGICPGGRPADRA
jgi:hypothetical protein